MVFKTIFFTLLKCGECHDCMVLTWEYIGSQRMDYQLYCVDEGKKGFQAHSSFLRFSFPLMATSGPSMAMSRSPGEIGGRPIVLEHRWPPVGSHVVSVRANFIENTL